MVRLNFSIFHLKIRYQKKKKKNHQRKKTAITQHGSKSKPIGRMIDKFH